MRLTILILCGLAAFMTACSSDEEVSGPDARRALLAEKWAVWRSLKLSEYDFEFTRECFCAGLTRTPVQISVKDGVVVEVRVVETGDVVSPEDVEEFFDITIEDLFRMIERAIGSDPAAMTIKYDKVAGYPRSLRVDPVLGLADEEYGFVTQLVDTSGVGI